MECILDQRTMSPRYYTQEISVNGCDSEIMYGQATVGKQTEAVEFL